MKTIIEAKKLNKYFEISKNMKHHVLKNINLTIAEGEFVSIMGPSGCGKTTLLYSISGMDKISSGSVVFDGDDFAVMSEQALSNVRISKMGFIFQQNSLLKNLNIIDNIVLSSYISGRENRAEINNRAKSLMRKTGIQDLANKNITQVSGGQLQRAAICRSLMNKPLIVFGDEPTGALDSKSSKDVMEILARENRAGTTILLVTHDLKLAAKTERVLFMQDGVIAKDVRLEKWKFDEESLAAREHELHSSLYSKN